MTRLLRHLRNDRGGSTIVEFAILAPAIITLFLGVLQVGMWMHSYNALRSIAAETGRYTAVQYQKANYISNIDMATWARDRAMDGYQFKSDDISTDVSDAADQQITGVTQKTLTLTYTFRSVMSIVGISDQVVTFSRPIFVKTT
jgi:Flp pilus assembly protein TadG